MKPRIVLGILMLSTVALAQSLVGTALKLNGTNEATFPAADGGSLFRGALLYGTGAGKLYVNNGTVWQGIPYSAEFQTQAAVSLYVDKAGSDSNACTSGGASACLSIRTAINKVPKLLRHPVTINVGAGTYSESLVISGFSNQDSGDGGTEQGSLNLVGAAAREVTSADDGFTSGASGTVVAYSDAIGIDPAWVTLSGTYSKDASGYVLLVGGTKRSVILNTDSTTYRVYLLSNLSPAPSVGDAYSIQIPSTQLLGRVFVMNNKMQSATGTPGIMFTRLHGLGPTGNVANISNSSIRFVDSKLQNANGIVLNAMNGSDVTLSDTVLYGSTSQPTLALDASEGTAYFSADTGSLVWGTARAAVSLASGQGSLLGRFALKSPSALGAAYAGILVSDAWSGTIQMPSRIECAAVNSGLHPGVGTAKAMYFGASGTATPLMSSRVNVATDGTFSIRGCGTGIWMRGPNTQFISSNATAGGLNSGCVSTTTCVRAELGARVVLDPTNAFVFDGGVTNELQIDGTNYQLADLDELTPKVITNASYGTTISR